MSNKAHTFTVVTANLDKERGGTKKYTNLIMNNTKGRMVLFMQEHGRGLRSVRFRKRGIKVLNRMRTPDPPPLIERNIMGYPIVGETVELLLNAAARAAEECASEHPEDIAFAMAFAVENVGPAIMDAYNKFGKQ